MPAGRSLLQRLIAGSDVRRTRLHDRTGARVPFGRLLRHGPRAVGGAILRVMAGYRPALPWISYDAQRLLARRLGPATRVLEFGSGLSTLWFARRAGSVVSIEHNPHWFAKVAQRLGPLCNVEHRLAEQHDDYIALPPEARFDLIVIDGPWRLSCALATVRHLAPGGAIYLDNSDKFVDAAQLLRDFAAKRGLPAREFIDFAPTQAFVQRGLLIG